MPNREGGYGGYRQQPGQKRQVRAPGAGGVRRVAPEDARRQPHPQRAGPQQARPAAPDAAPRRRPSAAAQQPSAAGKGPAAPRQAQAGRQEPPRRAPAQQPRQVYRAPAPPPGREAADGWLPPPAPRRAAPRQQQATPVQQALQSAARAARRNRRLRRRLTLIGTAACILLAAGVITVFLPSGDSGDGASAADPTAGLTESLVAPLPYAGVSEGENGISTALDWGDVGPARQTDSYTYTAATPESAGVPEMGRVDLSWFDDAAFLGDSLTVGFAEFEINVGDALICGYEGATPAQIANRATMNNDVRGEEVPLDVLASARPGKLYILLGANALAYQTDNDEGFLNYYGRMLDELIAALPDTMIFVQSVLPVQADSLADMPGLSPERVASVNSALQTMAAEKGCYYLALNEALVDGDGYLNADYAQPDGLHLSGSGYTAWVNYLCTHVPYDKDNPYQVGSEYYLTDEMKALLSDLP